MSSISGVSTNGVDLYNILQQSTASTASAGLAIAAPPPADGDSDPTDGTQETQGGHHHGHHGLQGKIESAVTSALSSADPSEDPNQVVQDAIASVLQDGNQGSSASGSSGQSGTGQAPDASSGSTSASQFAQLLQSKGISAQQFQSDLQAAWNDNGSGGQSLNFSTLFGSFPPGSAVDTTG